MSETDNEFLITATKRLRTNGDKTANININIGDTNKQLYTTTTNFKPIYNKPK